MARPGRKPKAAKAVQEAAKAVEAAADKTADAVETVAEKTASTVKRVAKKAPAKKEKEPTKTNMILQFGSNGEVNLSDLEEKIKAQFVAEGHRAGCIRNLDVYVKPEEGKAYYVINGGKFTGDVYLF